MLLFLDFETYYDSEFSLRKMTPAEYIFDPRFETICLGVAKNGGQAHLVDGPDIGRYLADLDARRITTVTYNALFDNAILAWRYGFIPRRMVDCLGMARALLGSRLRSLALASVAEHLAVGKKGDELKEVKGLHRADILKNSDLWGRFGSYCLNDTTTLRAIFDRLYDEFPREEYDVMDAVLRCCIEPRFHCDVQLLEGHLRDIRKKKADLCEAVGVHKDAISGNGSFLALLKEQGVEVKTKPGKRGEIPAIAKTDAFMQELLEDERPEVQCLAAARLGVKSTLEERRSERLIAIGSLPWPKQVNLMPIPLRYSGAHTWRLSGDWKINMQNLPSARMGDPILRRSLVAPAGSKVVVGDLAQIEARLVAWFCGSDILLTEFREKRDPYSRLAEQIFEVPVDKTTMQGVARHVGKAGILGCGYGMGPDKFYDSVLRQVRSMLRLEQFEVLNRIWTPELAKKSVAAYRDRYSEVRFMWSRLDRALRSSWAGKRFSGPTELGPITIGYNAEGDYGVVVGPGGREIRYPHPGYAADETGYWDAGNGLFWFPASPFRCRRARLDGSETDYVVSGTPTKIYGAALLENIIQFLARIVMFDIAIRLKNEAGLRFIHQVHDELVFIVPDEAVDHTKMLLNKYMRTPPRWASELPLDCDIGSGQRYGDCK